MKLPYKLNIIEKVKDIGGNSSPILLTGSMSTEQYGSSRLIECVVTSQCQNGTNMEGTG